MLSVGVRPRIEAADAGLLGIVGGSGPCVTRARPWPTSADLRVRWPNDVVVADGRKLAGLLVETALEDGRLAEAVIGIGINVNWPVADMPRGCS